MSTFLMFTASSTAYASWHAHHPTFLNQPHPEECHHANVNIGSAHNAVQSSSFQNNPDIDAQEQLALSTVKRNSSELNYRNWSDRELQILSDMAETMPITQLIRAFNQQLNQLGLQKRTQHSIRSKLQKLGFSANVQHGVYTVGMLSKKLSVPFATVSTWTRYHGLGFYRVTKNRTPLNTSPPNTYVISLASVLIALAAYLSLTFTSSLKINN
jgi:hypothetical protein